MNQVFLVGRLGQDPELRYTQNQTAVANFSLATTEYVKNEQQTEWHRVVCWGKTAENVGKYTQKGRQVAVRGRLQTRTWEDKNGNKQHTTEVVADRVEFLGDKEKGQGQGQRSGGGNRTQRNSQPTLDDIPF